MGATMGSQTLSKGSSRSRNAIPGHLYEKRRIFYYRFTLPKAIAPDLPRRELRVSLRTGYRTEALRLAAELHTVVTLSVEQGMKKGQGSAETQIKRLAEMRENLHRTLDKILHAPGKREISQRDIRLRLNGYLKYLLDKEGQEPPLPKIRRTNPDGTVEEIDPSTR